MWGGNFFTQAKPTNFHQFWTQKILLEDETVADFKEVTAAERSAIETADAKWTRPSEEFIAQCEHVGVRYNRTTGFFELNGLTDITEAQMRDIYRYTSGPLPQTYSAFRSCQFRTNLKPVYSAYWLDLSYMFNENGILEVCVLPQYYKKGVQTENMRGTFSGCYRLREIVNVIEAPQIASNSQGLYDAFHNCFALETVWLKKVYNSVDFRHSSKLRLECIEYLIENATNPNPITLMLHPDVFARVTDEIFAAASEKQISIATS